KWWPVRTNMALDENRTAGAAKQIQQQNGDVGKNGQLFECAADRQRKSECRVSDDRDIGRSIARMHVCEKFRQRAVAAESKDHSRRTQNVTRDQAKCGNGRARKKKQQ